MDEESDKIHLQVTEDGESLIDFSSENDALIFDLSSPLSASSIGLSHRHSSEHEREPENVDMLGKSNAAKEARMTPRSDQDEQLPYLTESSEPERSGRTGKCNLRKSLAWDSAFFTSAGVLEPEELSSMIKGADKREKQTLPGIQEDIRRSNDSISTLESDNLTLENLEAELFQDIRASIQKSSKTFKVTGIDGKTASGECQPSSYPKKVETISQDQVKQKTGIKKTNGTLKSQIKQTLRGQVPGKSVKQDLVHSQVVQSGVRTGNSIVTIPKPPRTISKGQAIPTAAVKRASLGATEENKTENGKTRLVTAAIRGLQGSKQPVSNGARRVLPKPASSLKSSSLGSSKSTTTEPARSSLSDSSGSISSNHTSKSPSPASRRKVGERTLNPTSSSSTLKTPSKTAPRNRTTGNAAVSAHLMSSKIPSSISPASSISEWSSASSTSSSTVNQRCNKSRTSFDSSSCRSLDSEILPADLESHSNIQITDGHGNESTRKSSTETGKLSQPSSMKPSGLRMPSPKIGFFDGVKSVRTPNGTMQPQATGSMASVPKSREAVRSPRGSLINMKSKTGKLPQARTSSASASTKPAAKKPPSPLSSQERMKTSTDVSSVLTNEKENGISRRQHDELSGHVDSKTCNPENGHLDNKLEPDSVSFSPTSLKTASRNPLVTMNPGPNSGSLDQS